MSTSYDKHRDQVEQARQTDGKFGIYSAGESGATLSAPTGATAETHRPDPEEQRKNERLTELARHKMTEAQSHDRVAAALATHEMLEDMRSRGIASLRVVDNSLGEPTGHYVSHATDADGEVIEEDDDNDAFDYETSEHYTGTLQSHFTHQDLNQAFENDPVNEHVDGWRIDAVDFRTGEPVTEVYGLDKEQAAAMRDKMIADAEPKGPRTQLRDALMNTGMARDDVMEMMRQSGDDVPRARTDHEDDIDFEFPDDKNRRMMARAVSGRLTEAGHASNDDGYGELAHRRAMDCVRKGLDDEEEIYQLSVQSAEAQP